jgi:hypothetical protein
MILLLFLTPILFFSGGMGLLGLMNLVYFAERYKEIARGVIAAGREYPWAATGINITNMLFALLGLRDDVVEEPPNHPFWSNPMLCFFFYADHDDSFDELYCSAFLLFDRVWVSTAAKYMDFPSVLARVQSALGGVLSRKPTDIKQMIAWTEQLQASFL